MNGWEEVASNMYRKRIPNLGWLVETYNDVQILDCENTITSTCFVPDPNGEWIIE